MKKLDTRDKLRTYQDEKVRKFIRNILPKSKFYRGYSTSDLKDIPIINKEKVLGNFKDMNIKSISLKDALEFSRKAEATRDFNDDFNGITIGLSSGTSGKQNVFMASKIEKLKWAGIILAKALPRSIFREEKIAFFLRANSNLYTTLSKNQRIQFEFFDLTKSFDDNLRKLNSQQPSIISAPPSVLSQIAKAQKQGFINVRPKRIFSVAEVLDDKEQSYIEEVFSQKVHQVYQCTEGFLGISKTDGKLYLNEEFVHVEKEWVDKKSGKFIPIITDFTRTTQPIVRYRLDDILVEDLNSNSPVTCIKRIEGRCDDVLYFFNKDKKGLIPVFSDVIRRVMTVTKTHFNDYRMIQHSPEALELQFVGCSEDIHSKVDREEIKVKILDLVKEHGCLPPIISFRPFVHTPAHIKVRRIQRNYSLPMEVLS